jgi:ankyrin repeat protein
VSGHKAIVEMLLASGADINIKRNDGLTALDIVHKKNPGASDEDRALRKAIAGVLVRNGATAAKYK